MNTYELDNQQYDVAKLPSEAQSLFHLLVSTKAEADIHKKQLTILTAAYNGFAVKLNEYVSEEALIPPDQQ